MIRCSNWIENICGNISPVACIAKGVEDSTARQITGKCNRGPSLNRSRRRMIRAIIRAGVVPLLACLLLGPVSASPIYPLKTSADKRYLTDQSGAPFLLVGDSPHSLAVNLSETDAAAYLRDRATNG